MKTFLTLILQLIIAFLILVPSSFHSQSPLGIPYQAVMRNANGSVIASSAVSLTFMIHDGSATGTVVYQESHALTSNAQGLVSCVVGNGVVSQGNFADINWGSGAKFLQVMMGAADLGTQQMLSVPYALYSEQANSIANGIYINSISSDGDSLMLSNGQTFVSSVGQGSNSNGALIMPIITTNAVTGITSNSATFGGSVSNANDYEIMERGVVYSTSPHPTINSTRFQIGTGIGAFDSISALSYQYAHLLTPNTTYYVRAYAITENNVSAYGNEVSFQTLSIGEIGPGGGRVFFNKGNIDGGWQYLEVSPNDQSTSAQWGCIGTSISGISNLVGTGEFNTNQIVNNCSGSTAAEVCLNLSLGGQTDWFLPSRDELNLIYKNVHLSGILVLSANDYWSSSELHSQAGFKLYFGPGNGWTGSNKNYNYYVRAIRAF
ncbi:MAG: hypothetical protein RLY35_1364 [Bacteroidota bacterium]|jgi:hypothetical protein